jgi:hypothetical protein
MTNERGETGEIWLRGNMRPAALMAAVLALVCCLLLASLRFADTPPAPLMVGLVRAFCVLAATVLAMRVWPPDDLSMAHYDRLYALAVLKYERRRGASAKSDDVVAMLEEETEALVRANYQAAADHGD